MMYDDILDLLSALQIPHFFITATCAATGHHMPQGIEAFVTRKAALIQQGCEARKFVYSEHGWRLIFTFFPTNEVVSERYALKNQVYKRR